MSIAHTVPHTRHRPTVDKPDKPWPGFPLYWHPRGYWMCRRNGEDWIYEADALASHRRFVIDEAHLHKGTARVEQPKRYTLKDAVNYYLTRQKKRHDDGELGDVQFTKCRSELEYWLPRAVKLSTPLDAFRANNPGDTGPGVLFAAIRTKAMVRGLDAAHRHITIVRAALDYAVEKKLSLGFDYGDDFDPPSQSKISKGRRGRDQRLGERAWSLDELRLMLVKAEQLANGRKSKDGKTFARNPHLHAQILLGLYGGFGSDDLSVLTESSLDRKKGIIKHDRAKNDRPCICAVPKIVWDAIDRSLNERVEAAGPDAEPLLFRTSNGTRCNVAAKKLDAQGILLSIGRNDTIGKNFQRFAKRIGLGKPRAGFKTLRAMCRTMMTGSGVDDDIRAAIMGRPTRFPVDEFYIRGDLREKLFFARDAIHNQLFPKRTGSRRRKNAVALKA